MRGYREIQGIELKRRLTVRGQMAMLSLKKGSQGRDRRKVLQYLLPQSRVEVHPQTFASNGAFTSEHLVGRYSVVDLFCFPSEYYRTSITL